MWVTLHLGLHGLEFWGMEKKKVSFHLADATVPFMVTIGLFMRNDHVLSF
jgi:hypothetical protein